MRGPMFYVTLKAHSTMSTTETYIVTLPNGAQRGPMTSELLLEVARDGGLPPDATVDGLGTKTTVAEFLVTRGEQQVARRLSKTERAEIGATVAASPKALTNKDSK